MASTHHSEISPHDIITQVAISDVELAPIEPQNSKETDSLLVVFAEPYDADNPKDWTTGRKWAVTDVLSATGFNRIMVSTIMAPALSLIAKEFDMNSAESAMALSIYLLATAFGPLVIGPLSEVYGRKPILHASNIWFLIWNLVCGFANSKEVLIGSRFLAGFGASAIYALANGVLGDVWRPEQRGRSLSIYLLIPLLGAAVGPIIGGFMAGRTTWRWMFWSTSIFQAVMIFVAFTAFQETYEPLILRSRADQIRRDTGDNRYYTLDERQHTSAGPWRVLGRALLRPLRLLAFHPIIQITSIISGLGYGVLYIVLSTFSDLWTKHYGQSVEISGLHYIACALGEIIGSQICATVMDRLYHRMTVRSERAHFPELRLPSIIPGAVIAPLGLLLYGWTAQYLIHWAVVDLAILIALLGMQIMTAFLFPLFAPRMYEVMGYGWGNSTIAIITILVGVSGPAALWVYGEKLRGKARAVL
ncbi:major facilitator superfamily domain-containing protein [Aspergillus keveii]|uniref:Major facilitator superfamily domain-containing protein n=1 Tax=Aspergillus keveii TaxID=714993 RepID=A0ABR4GDV8_9EURO